MKLHLGCGDVHLDGFVNIDSMHMPTVDAVADIRYLHARKYPKNSADLIYASHVLEHFTRWEYGSVLRRWFDILKPGGILRVAVPDFEKICLHYQKHKDLPLLRGSLYGGQDYENNFHHWCWDFDSLSQDLEEVGFREVYRYDWRETEHAHVDDNSQGYQPHMDKENGMLISLNVEAVK